jgi:transposase
MPPNNIKDLAKQMRKDEREAIKHYLDTNGHNVPKVAKSAGVTEKAVYGWLKRYGFRRTEKYVLITNNAQTNE